MDKSPWPEPPDIGLAEGKAQSGLRLVAMSKGTDGGDATIAIVRPPGESFRLAVSLHPDRNLIDPERARTQHAEYRATLERFGIEVTDLPADELYPDSCFTQDPAFVLDGRALILRPGIESRAGEAESLEEALRPLVDSIEHIEPPATLEGGDVLRVGSRLLVGRSTRTNDEGIEALRRFATPMGYSVAVVPVPRGVLHLSTGVTFLGNGLMMGLGEMLQNEAFEGFERLEVGDAPLAACNVLTLGDQVIASGDYRIHDELERRGYKVHRLDLTEFVRADAGPTCLCLLIDSKAGSARA
jgi:dimethylargininase